ncbi:MAG: hypothetical protein JKY71_03645 [Alphaproteobacteria bacterium]|nr:hypothetical protein [Alphaproteobacteria bacterium]
MNTEKNKIILLIVNNDFAETEDIKNRLNQEMRVPWSLAHCVNVEEARSRINKASVVILKPEMEDLSSAEEVFKTIENMAFEIPIIVLRDDNHDKNGLSTYVMEKGAADILIRGQFSRLVDAIEFAIIRQKIKTGTRKASDKTLQDSKDVGEIKYKESCDQRLKDQEANKHALSMFMGDYSSSTKEET